MRDSRCLFIIDRRHNLPSGILLGQVDLLEDLAIENPKTEMDQSRIYSP